MFFVLRSMDFGEAAQWMDENLSEWPYWSNYFGQYAHGSRDEIRRTSLEFFDRITGSRACPLPMLFTSEPDWLMTVLHFGGRKGNTTVSDKPSPGVVRSLAETKRISDSTDAPPPGSREDLCREVREMLGDSPKEAACGCAKDLKDHPPK